MPGPDDPLRSALKRLATPADPAAAYERIVEKKIRRQIFRRLRLAGLVVVVLIGTVGGTVLLATAFRGKAPTQRTAIAPSADNGKIAFVSNRSGERSDLQAVSVMNPDGTHVVGVAGPQVRRAVALSPDGTRIAYSVGLNEIVVANADGTGEKVLTYVSDLVSPPAWSSDGTRIAYAPGPIFDIEVIPVRGGRPVHLTRPPSGCTDNYPMWSPDGSRVAFLRSCGAPAVTDVNVMKADGSNLVNLTNGSIRAIYGGSWSPDGSAIAFVVRVRPGNMREGADSQIATIKADGSGFRQLTTDGDNRSPVWSPDGRFIAFTSNRSGRFHVYKMSADGTGQSDLTPDSSVEAQVISWLPATASSVLPRESPLATPPGTPQPSVTPSGSPPPPYCEGSSVAGDFDGDGRLDTAAVCPVPDGYSLGVTWGSGASGAVALTPEPCQDVCEPVAAADLDGDGADEFVLLANRGASTEFLVVYELPVSEAFGQHSVTVAEPGAPGFPAGEPAVFPIDGSVTHLDFLTCQTADDGTHQIVATSAVLNKEQTEYGIQEVVFVLDPGANSPYGQFAVVSSTSSTFAFDPTGASQPRPRGEPCWEPPAQSSPSPYP